MFEPSCLMRGLGCARRTSLDAWASVRAIREVRLEASGAFDWIPLFTWLRSLSSKRTWAISDGLVRADHLLEPLGDSRRLELGASSGSTPTSMSLGIGQARDPGERRLG